MTPDLFQVYLEFVESCYKLTCQEQVSSRSFAAHSLKDTVPAICFLCFWLGACLPNSYFLSPLLEGGHSRQGLFLGDHCLENKEGLGGGRTGSADRQVGE